MRSTLLTLAVLGAACHGAAGGARGDWSPTPAPALSQDDGAQAATLAPDSPAAGSPDEEPGLEAPVSSPVGWVLRDPEKHAWGVRLRTPFSFSVTDFDFDFALTDLDKFQTLALVPTAEFIFPISESWKLLPFVGIGGAWLTKEDEFVWLVTAGVRGEYINTFKQRYHVLVWPGLRADTTLNNPDSLLGDWGRVDLAVELRRTFGDLQKKTHFQPGIFAQYLYYWNEIEIDIPGVTPTIESQYEFGLSFGSSTRYKVLGISIPRLFLGVQLSENTETLFIRFGQL